jgi:hypothetical protein
MNPGLGTVIHKLGFSFKIMQDNLQLKRQWLYSQRLVEPHKNICHVVQISPHLISGLFGQNGSFTARNFKVIKRSKLLLPLLLKLAANALHHVFEKWMDHCKWCITCQGRYFEKETTTAPPRSSDWE